MVLVIAGVVFFAVYARQAAYEFLFQPPISPYERDASFDFVSADDGTSINLYWSGGREGAWTVLYLCGSEEDLAVAMPRLITYQLKGFNVASFDYRGFGHTEGEPSESLLYDDAEVVYDYLLREKGIDESRIVLHGRSLGGGVATELATRRAPSRLILESTFTSVYDNLLSLKWIPGDLFENEDKASRVACPTLLIHGAEDSVVEVTHSHALKESFEDELATQYIVPKAGHRNVDRVGGQAYWAAIEGFIRRGE